MNKGDFLSIISDEQVRLLGRSVYACVKDFMVKNNLGLESELPILGLMVSNLINEILIQSSNLGNDWIDKTVDILIQEIVGIADRVRGEQNG